MHVIVGLGNPGRAYENTRHNVGFKAIDLLAEGNQIKLNKIKHKALVGEGFISGQKVLLVKPQTYMNLSGQSVREILEYYKVPPENLLVLYDDIDIPSGRIRIRMKGSGGTHNGMRSILYDINTDQFPRVRIGIGKETPMDLKDFVLSGFSKEEKTAVEKAIQRAADGVVCYLEKGIEKAMGEYNVKE